MKKVRRKIYNLSKDIGDKIGIDLPYYVENGFWATIGQVIQIVVGILLSVVLARFTSEKILGQYNFLISILTIFSIISLPGINVSLLRSVARKKHGTYKKAVKFSFLWSLAGLPLTLLIGAYYYFYDEQIIGIGIFVAAIFSPLIFPFASWDSLYQGQSKFSISTYFNSIKTVIIAGFVSVSIFFGKDNLILIFISYLASNTFTNLLFYYLSFKHIKNDDIENSWKKSSYKLSLIAVISLIYDHADKIIIGVFFEPEKLAVYSIAVSIIIYLRTAIKMLIRVIMPKLFAADKELLQNILRKYIVKFFVVLILGSIVFYFLLPFVITILYSTKYENSVFYAQIYLISIPATGLVMFLQNYLIAFNSETLMIKVKLIFTVLNLLLYILLIPYFGIFGAVVSSIIYYYMLLFVFSYYAYKK